MLEISNQLLDLIKADSNVIEVVTYEWQRLNRSIEKVCEELHRQFLVFTPAKGITIYGINQSVEALYGDVKIETFKDVLAFFEDKVKDAILLIEDFEQYLDSTKYNTLSFIKAISRDENNKPSKLNKSLIFSTPNPIIPAVISKDISIISLPYASREDIKDVFDRIANSLKFDYPKAKIFYEDQIGESLLGLSETEINRVLRKVINECGEITIKELPYFLQEKEKSIESNSLIELVKTDVSLEDVGGLNTLKSWCTYRRQAFDFAASRYGLPMPKGMMLLGVPGCGKSLVAKALAHDWKFPLLRLDFGRLYNRYLGESEANLRHAIDIAEAISPCILWVDEIEKGLAGSRRSFDNGVASRLLGTFLTWMQEKKKPVFIVATANHISQIPSELFRKGRFDEIFFLDLPNISERKAIIDIHLSKKPKVSGDVDIQELAEVSKGFSGAEIECAINDALFEAYMHNHGLLTHAYLYSAFKASKPLSCSMEEDINSIQIWGQKTIKSAR